MSATHSAEVVVIGAGVVGLAIAAELSRNRSVILVEAHKKFGQETSSRNSEVIHSGIYYPLSSKKTELCLRGRELLYNYCEKRGVAFRKTGKFVVATSGAEQNYLEGLSQHCAFLQVPFRRVSGAQIASVEPEVRASSGLLFPESGIVNSHELMASLERDFLNHDGTAGYRCRVTDIYDEGDSWAVEFQSGDDRAQLTAEYVVNCAGLAAAEISNMALKTKRYEHKFCRGRYFGLSGKYMNRFHRLIYPVPEKHGLGVHVTIDTNGMPRLGPDVEWCPEANYATRDKWYDCAWEEWREPFLQAARKYCPGLKPEDLLPGLIGIRPKLFVEEVARPDFLVEKEKNWIHCLGIESPGLTAALAISEQVGRLMREA